MTKKKVPERAREILDYFFRNPQAADTLEGVTRWRLLRETVHRHVEETAEAFEWLVAEGFLNETLTTYSKPIYSFNTEAAAKAEHFLGQEKTPPED